MGIKFYYDESNNLATVLAKSFDKRVQHVYDLMSLVADDYPEITANGISVRVFGPPRHEHMIGVQFTPTHEPPEKYVRSDASFLCDYYYL